ncbi:MAG TPA: hypothetical protein H9691_01440 [Firmicutes bacterium]|nr:hypothetical protein [Bacillota bacterium]
MDPMYELVKAYEPEKPEERKARKLFWGILLFVALWRFLKRRSRKKAEQEENLVFLMGGDTQ